MTQSSPLVRPISVGILRRIAKTNAQRKAA
jgi:hypothetical protein